jgi:small subunit ribosomal protein S16
MLKIRLKRTGRKGQPHYRVVVMESTQPRDGKTIDEIGYYNPRTNPTTFDIDEEKAKEWLTKGAKPTETVAGHFVKLGLIESMKKGSTKPDTTKGSKKDKEE